MENIKQLLTSSATVTSEHAFNLQRHKVNKPEEFILNQKFSQKMSCVEKKCYKT